MRSVQPAVLCGFVAGAIIGLAISVGEISLLLNLCRIVFGEDISFSDLLNDSGSPWVWLIVMSAANVGAAATIGGFLSRRWASK
jgi:hypothetical protein